MAVKYERTLVTTLVDRLMEPRRFMQIVVGPRQTGKTTALRQTIKKLPRSCHYASADDIVSQTRGWLQVQWDIARDIVVKEGQAVLFLDEVQHIPQWSSLVKALWDEDSWHGVELQVVITGSSALLLQSGLAESLTGRFERIDSPQWSFSECQKAFDLTLEEYLEFGGYPGSATLRKDFSRWQSYLEQAIIEPTITRDVLALERVQKPALLRALFYLGAQYSSCELSYRKLMGQLNDAGNTTTLAHYLKLLEQAGILCGIPKFYGNELRARNSTPRLMVFDTSLMVAAYKSRSQHMLVSSDFRGHLIETAVGAYLLKRSIAEGFDLSWWRDGDKEIDFVLKLGDSITVIEVKSGIIKNLGGFVAFASRYPVTKQIIVGSPQTPLKSFLLGQVELF